MTDAQPKNPGEELRVSRERLGLSLREVAIATKINARILKALEEGDRDALPAKSFARGFIRSYASYLKIDPDPILAAYGDMRADSGRPRLTDEEPEVQQENPVPTQNTPEIKPRASYGEKSIASRVAIFAVIFLLVGLVIFVKKMKDKYAREKANPALTSTLPHGVLAPPQENTVTKPTVAKQPVVKPPVAKSPVAKSPAAKATSTNKPVMAKAKVSSPTPPAAAPKKIAPQAKSKGVFTQPTLSNKPRTIAKVVPPHPVQEIIVEALDTVDVTIRVGNTPAQKVHLVPQAVHTVKTNEPVVLSVTDGGMVNIVRNGRDQGVPGQLGKPITLKYP